MISLSVLCFSDLLTSDRRYHQKRQAKRDGVPWTHADEDNWSPQAKSGLLFQMNWHRIIIDEAQ